LRIQADYMLISHNHFCYHVFFTFQTGLKKYLGVCGSEARQVKFCMLEEVCIQLLYFGLYQIFN